MRNHWWKIAIGLIGFGAFFWSLGGVVDLGLEEHALGRYGLPDEGDRYTVALWSGGVAAIGSLLGLAGRLAGRKIALLPASGLAFGAVSVLVLGREPRHWVAAGVMALAGAATAVAAYRYGRAGRPHGNAPGGTPGGPDRRGEAR
ncbi:hypothetical protein ACPCSC_01075 [Streptomyces lavendulocolor]|uniref:hypothetical protein n=1 Tax=Streptomyces lavendulocolor TaxID=67316 RepID=UPI003C2CD4C1